VSLRIESSKSSYQAFKNWVTSNPLPAKLLVDTPDGEKVLAVEPNQTRAWGKLHQALISFGAIAVEAQNEKGEMLRRFDVTEVNAEEEEDAAVATVTLPMPASEDARMLSLFAQLLAGAYRDGASSQRQSSDAAFKMLVGLAEGAFKRIDVLERTLTRMRGAAPPSEEAASSAGAGDVMGLIAQFMQGAQMAQAAKANGMHAPPAAAPEDEGEEESDAS
jgi:hypothetical protein